MEAEIIEFLKAQGLLMTAKRICIISAICEVGRITDVEDFWLKIRETHHVSWATIHSTLRLMSYYGILRRETNGHGLVAYHLLNKPENNISEQPSNNK